MLKEYVKEELILLNLDISNRNDLFRQLSEIFQERGYINEGFYDFIVEREENYPTGLDLGTQLPFLTGIQNTLSNHLSQWLHSNNPLK